MKHETITTAEHLHQFCKELAKEPVIAFDTEFVSEDRYRPELCLLQVQAGDRLAIIDPQPIGTTEAFWKLISTPGRIVVVHAGREEMRFCWRFSGKPIANCFDIQLAAGFIGLEYPASLGNLVKSLCGKTLGKGETRTDWRRRPLSDAQIEYALQDVTDLVAMYNQLSVQVDQMQRRSWLDEEIGSLQDAIAHAEQNESWHRVSGSNSLGPRQQAIVREIWRWREARAQKTDQPPRRILRDDLIVELALRGSSDPKRIKNVRGMERRNLVPHHEAIAHAIDVALSLNESELPVKARGFRRAKVPMLNQFLSTAMACVSRTHKMAPAIVGNSDDVRELLSYELAGESDAPLPALLRGWRGDVVGRSFREVLAGRLAIRVADHRASQPLEFIEVDK